MAETELTSAERKLEEEEEAAGAAGRVSEDTEEEEDLEDLEDLVGPVREFEKDMGLIANENESAIEDMDTAIRGLKDWRKEREEQIARLEKENEKLFESMERSAAVLRDRDEGTSGAVSGLDDDEGYKSVLKELNNAKSQMGTSKDVLESSPQAGTELSEEKLRLLTSASKMSFAPAQSAERAEREGALGVGGAKGALGEEGSSISLLREADELLESLGLEEGQNDPIAWTSDLNTVLSKLEMLDAPEK